MVRGFLFGAAAAAAADDGGSAVDCDIVSDEHCAVDNGVEDAAPAPAGSGLPSRLLLVMYDSLLGAAVER